MTISIHAPPRGATAVLRGERAEAEMISIHAPPRGATYLPLSIFPHALFQFTPLREGRQQMMQQFQQFKAFQFTPLREGRRRHASGQSRDVDISIHAPPRGATIPQESRLQGGKFQFTPLREGRHGSAARVKHAAEFQFTPLREGRRGVPLQRRALRHISIHAPPRGATPAERRAD